MHQDNLSEEEEEKKLKEEEQKLLILREEYQDYQRHLELTQEMMETIEEELKDVLDEESKYQDEQEQYEDLIRTLEQEIDEKNQQQNEKNQSLNIINQQVHQDMKEGKEELQNAQEHQKEKFDANMEIKNLNEQINQNNQKIQEMDKNEQIIEDAKRKQEEEEQRKKKIDGIFSFLSAIISIFCPITAAITALVGKLITNGDYTSALKKVADEKLNYSNRKKQQEDLVQRQKQLEAVSEEKFQKALRSAQSKSLSILKGLNTKKEVENKLNSLQESMKIKQKSIFDLTQQKLSCSSVIENIKQKHQELIPKFQDLKVKSTHINLADFAKKIKSQQEVVKNFQLKIQKNKEKQTQDRQRNQKN